MRKTAIIGLAAAAFLAAAPARALPEGWYKVGPGIPYRCHGNHMSYDTVGRLRTIIFKGAVDIRNCQELCDSTSGCVAFSFQRRVSEKGVAATACILLGRYDVDTVPIGDRGPFDWGAVCYRHHEVWDKLPNEWRNRLGLEQDQMHPGLRPTVPAIPVSPNK